MQDLSIHWEDERHEACRSARPVTSVASSRAAVISLRLLVNRWSFSLEDMQTAAFWRGRGVGDGAEERVREIVKYL
jgi:hypothetical protein